MDNFKVQVQESNYVIRGNSPQGQISGEIGCYERLGESEFFYREL